MEPDIEKLCDLLYLRGYEDRRRERDYDPRGTTEWQQVHDKLKQNAELVEAGNNLRTFASLFEAIARAESAEGESNG